MKKTKTMIPLKLTKKNSINVCHEDLRVLMNLTDSNPAYAAKFLTNKTEDEARTLLAALNNDEVTSLYDLMVT